MGSMVNKKPKVVIAGLGDTGLLTAINLGANVDVVGISAKPCLLSGQELGSRLTRPDEWQHNYLIDFSRYKKLDHLRFTQGLIQSIDTQQQLIELINTEGQTELESYDVLVLSPGVSNGFWRNTQLLSKIEIKSEISQQHDRLFSAKTVAVVGAGASGVSVAANLAEENPQASVHLFFAHEHILPGYHPRVRRRLSKRLQQLGVFLHAGHRADLSAKSDRTLNSIDQGLISWQGEQENFTADAIIWCVGNLKPNNAFIPADMLNEQGFVKADEYLRVPGFDNVFTVGDIAASDPNKSSARNAGFLIVAANIKKYLANAEQHATETHSKPIELKYRRYKASRYRWGSILGAQASGMRVFTPTGHMVRVPKYLVDSFLFPVVVAKFIYRGIRQ